MRALRILALGVSLGAGLLVGLTGAQGQGDPARGARVFQRCFSCHSVDPQEKAELQGPTLFRIIGRPAGAIEGYDYSEGMRAMAAAGLIWDEATLESYMIETETMVPGTRMRLIPPLTDDGDRADLIAYLKASGPHVR